MELTRKSAYPMHKMDLAGTDDVEQLQVVYRKDVPNDVRIKKHFFDVAHDLTRKHCKKSIKLSKPNETQKGCLPIRAEHYRPNESKIPALKKLGIYEGDQRLRDLNMTV